MLLIACSGLLGCGSPGLPPHAATPVNSTPELQTQVNQTERHLSLFRSHLARHYPGGQWKHGPEGIDSPELRQAYPGSRFYYVASPEPLPRGAYTAPKAGSKGSNTGTTIVQLSLCVRFGPEGRLKELHRPEDYNEGLAPVRSDADARNAAAAILSTMAGSYFGPAVVSNASVQVQKSPEGWACRLQTQTREGRVGFNLGGSCISASLVYSGPMPR